MGNGAVDGQLFRSTAFAQWQGQQRARRAPGQILVSTRFAPAVEAGIARFLEQLLRNTALFAWKRVAVGAALRV